MAEGGGAGRAHVFFLSPPPSPPPAHIANAPPLPATHTKNSNDAYSAVQVASALASALGVGINDLPLSLDLSWLEQKAVAVLLTLLHLGVKNIR